MLTKTIKDFIARKFGEFEDKLAGNSQSVPRGLYDLSQYFRHEKGINFEIKKEEGDFLVAVSTNYRYGSIIAYAESLKELDEKIKDAILTSFSIPSSYAKEAQIIKMDGQKLKYALA